MGRRIEWRLHVGRLFLQVYRTRGTGYEFRQLHRDNPGLSLWVGRLIFVVALVHAKSCRCAECDYEKFMGFRD